MDLMLGENVVVVTGGASGIGLAAAKLFHAEGAKVVVWDLNPPEETLFSSRRVDITSSEEIEQTMQATLEEYGRIDHLVHAAAIGSGKFGFPFDINHFRHISSAFTCGRIRPGYFCFFSAVIASRRARASSARSEGTKM